jgi:hypothetical protein
LAFTGASSEDESSSLSPSLSSSLDEEACFADVVGFWIAPAVTSSASESSSESSSEDDGVGAFLGTGFESVTFLGAMTTGFDGASSSELLSLSSEDEGAFAMALGFSSSESSSLLSSVDEGSLALNRMY